MVAQSAENPMYNLDEVANILRMNQEEIIDLLENGFVRGTKTGSTWQIAKTTVTDWLAAKKYVNQIDPSLARRTWTKEELDKFVEEDQLD